MKKRIFISFAIPFNLEARNDIYRQSLDRDCVFTVSGWSVRPAQLRENWEQDTRHQIERADAVVALVGAYTKFISNVGEEVDIARELGKPIFALRIDDEPNPPSNIIEIHETDELARLLSAESACRG